MEWRASAAQMVDNFLDIGHFPFVHGDTFGYGADGAAAIEWLGEEAGGFSFRVTHTGYKVTAGSSTELRGAPQQRYLTYRYKLPFLVSIELAYSASSATDHINLLIKPHDRDSSYLFKLLSIDDNSSSVGFRAQEAEYQRRITAEDQAICENLPSDILLETDGRDLGNDLPGLALRRKLLNLLP